MLDLAIVGAGPIGLEAAIRAKRAGLRYRVFEKGSLVHAIYRYPTYMTFFTTSDRLEIGGHPLVTSTDKPTRKEALEYYRKVAHAEALEVEGFSKVTGLSRGPDSFDLAVESVKTVASKDDEMDAMPSGSDGDATARRAHTRTVRARFVALATGYFDHPNLLGIPGEDLPHVSHAYDEAHPYYGRDVVIVGAGSSAADAALDLYRGGARVTMVHRGDDFRHSLKYWIRPNLENRVAEGSIKAHFATVVDEITHDAVVVEKNGSKLSIPADRVFLLTGYHASDELLRQVGAVVDRDTLAARLDEHYQSTVPGLYCIGSAGFGRRTSDVFIENGLVHAEAAIEHIASRVPHSTDA